MVLVEPVTQHVKKRKRRRSRRKKVSDGLALSRDGLLWLRAALAERDFPGGSCNGIPDGTSEDSAIIKFSYQGTFTGDATYCAIPSPNVGLLKWAPLSKDLIEDALNVSLFLKENPLARDLGEGYISLLGELKHIRVWLDQPQAVGLSEYSYRSADRFFPAGSAAFEIINRYRLVSLNMEVCPDSSPLQTAGVQTCLRVDTGVSLTGLDATSMTQIFGTLPIDAPSMQTGDPTVIPLMKGSYMVSLPIKAGYEYIETAYRYNRKIGYVNQSGTGLLGLPDAILTPDNWQTLCVNIKGTNATTSYTVSVHSSWEMIPVDGTIVDHMTSPAAGMDTLALAEMIRLKSVIPQAVVRSANAGFWNFIKKAARGIWDVVGKPVAQAGLTALGSTLGGLVI